MSTALDIPLTDKFFKVEDTAIYYDPNTDDPVEYKEPYPNPWHYLDKSDTLVYLTNKCREDYDDDIGCIMFRDFD